MLAKSDYRMQELEMQVGLHKMQKDWQLQPMAEGRRPGPDRNHPARAEQS